MTENSKCPISLHSFSKVLPSDDFVDVDCPACGHFQIEDSAIVMPDNNNYTEEQRALLSHKIRQRYEADKTNLKRYRSADLEKMLEGQLPQPKEQMDNLILYLGRNTKPGENLCIDYDELSPYIGSLNFRNSTFICAALKEQEYLSFYQHHNGTNKGELGLSVKGLERYYDLTEQKVNDTKLAFMAMPFGNDTLDSIFKEWFKPACKAVGFDLRRVDERPEAGIINQKMMVDIRKSRFLIAELTCENRGVYWEAGFAEGLNRPVIYTCHKVYEKKKSLHFDIRQHYIIFWTQKTLEKAARDLVIALQATLPAETGTVDVNAINWKDLRKND
jgi:hypothetical protein